MSDIKKIIAAHDKLKVENEKLKKDLQDGAGDYIRRIEDQKTRAYRLEKERDNLITECLKLQDQVNQLSRYVALNASKGF